MIIVGLVLSVFAVGLFCWLLFMFAVYALPFFVGMTAGLAAFHSGAGVVGALLAGVVAGAATLVVGQVVFAVAKPPLLRVAIACFFAAPAAIAGYHATLGLAQIGVPSEIWREVIAVTGAICVGGTAFMRVSLLAAPRGARQVLVVGTARPSSPQLVAGTRDG